MNEWLIIVCSALGGGLFAAGGTHIPVIGGKKWLRRYLLPAIWAACLYLSGVSWWKCLIFAILQAVTFTLPYGDRTPKWGKIAVFTSFVLPVTLFGFTWWIIISPVIISTVFFLSNSQPTAKVFPHKTWELITGGLLGIMISQSVP